MEEIIGYNSEIYQLTKVDRAHKRAHKRIIRKDAKEIAEDLYKRLTMKDLVGGNLEKILIEEAKRKKYLPNNLEFITREASLELFCKISSRSR